MSFKAKFEQCSYLIQCLLHCRLDPHCFQMLKIFASYNKNSSIQAGFAEQSELRVVFLTS